MMEVRKKDIILILDKKWNGVLVVVEEVRSWGVQCFTQIPMQGSAFYRVKNGDFEIVGRIPDNIEITKLIR